MELLDHPIWRDAPAGTSRESAPDQGDGERAAPMADVPLPRNLWCACAGHPRLTQWVRMLRVE
jgi:hypothetical protein